jgi:hypothetical protein
VAGVTVLQAQRRVDYLTRDPAPKMGQVARLGSGGLRIPAAYTRIGVFHYRESSDWVGELRLPEEVFAAESLASLRGVPLTLLHPDVPVTRTAWPAVARGHVCDDVHVEGIHVRGHVVAAHPELCFGIEAGELCELSCGYTADVEIAEGEWQGTPYQRIQRRIRYDHVAVGPRDWARGGPSVRLTLDGGRRSSISVPYPLLSGGRTDRPVTLYRADDRAGAPMSLKFLREKRAVEVGGREFDLTKPTEAAAAREAVRADTRRRTDALDPAQAAMAIDELRGHLDVANQLLMDLAANLVKADVAAEQTMSPEQLDARMEEYADTITKARTLHPQLEHKGKSIEQIKREALAARGVKTDGEPASYVEGAFKAALTAGVSTTFSRADLAQMGDDAQAGRTADTGPSALSANYKKPQRGRGANA